MFKYRVFDKTEKIIKDVISIEWEIDNLEQIIEVRTDPLEVYKGGDRLTSTYPNGAHGSWRSIGELVFLEPTGDKDSEGKDVWSFIPN